MKIHEYQAKAILAEVGVPIPGGAWPRRRPRSRPSRRSSAVRSSSRPRSTRADAARGRRQAGSDTGGGRARRVPNPGHDAPDAPDRPRRTAGEGGCWWKRPWPSDGSCTSHRHRPRCGFAVLMASAAGGMDIEEVARTRPDAIVKVHVDPRRGSAGSHAQAGLRLGSAGGPGEGGGGFRDAALLGFRRQGLLAGRDQFRWWWRTTAGCWPWTPR